MHDDPSLTPITAAEKEWLRDFFAGRAPAFPADGSVDIPHLLRVTQEHGLQPLLFARSSGWPAQLVEPLRREAFRQLVLAEQRARRLRKVVDAAAARAIVPLFIKGVALSEAVYPSVELRPRVDTDLLITRAEAAPFIEALKELDYRSDIPPADAPGNQLIVRGRDPQDVLDVHWAMSNARQFARLFDVDTLRRRGSINARGLLVPSLVDSLLIACVHRVAHHYGSERLIWLCDIVLLWEALTAEERQLFWERAVEAAIVTVCADGLLRAFQWFRKEMPPPDAREWVGPAAGRGERSARSLDPGRLRLTQLASDVHASDGMAEKLRFLRRLAFPDATQIRLRFPNSPAPLPLLYVRRGFRAVRKLFTRLRE